MIRLCYFGCSPITNAHNKKRAPNLPTWNPLSYKNNFDTFINMKKLQSFLLFHKPIPMNKSPGFKPFDIIRTYGFRIFSSCFIPQPRLRKPAGNYVIEAIVREMKDRTDREISVDLKNNSPSFQIVSNISNDIG